MPAFWNPLDIQYYLIINPLIYVHIRIQYICRIWTQYLVEGKFKDQKYPICKNKNKMWNFWIWFKGVGMYVEKFGALFLRQWQQCKHPWKHAKFYFNMMCENYEEDLMKIWKHWWAIEWQSSLLLWDTLLMRVYTISLDK